MCASRWPGRIGIGSELLGYLAVAMPPALATVVGGIDGTGSAAAAGDAPQTRVQATGSRGKSQSGPPSDSPPLGIRLRFDGHDDRGRMPIWHAARRRPKSVISGDLSVCWAVAGRDSGRVALGQHTSDIDANVVAL